MQHTLSNKALLKSTIIAVAIAGLVLVSFILPAEYNIDPTGVGTKLGLTALANPVATSEIKTKQNQSNTDNQQAADIIEVIVPAGRGVEYKFAMTQFKKMEYQWQTDDTALFFDLHGEPEGDTTGYYESYAIATLTEMKGSFTTPFTGIHGWYWKNTSDKPVTVKLNVSGEYTIVGLKK
ncbi:hypothetical protein [Colwellia sp. 12G3]|uniref:hypothetical protein n=1 Tax=Colwellia sp. 12G3 TaxID=2058299 RepID=UPI000C323269|nr:hypothetical protein [Colwellia sp. 12G3]PKI15865.1 hypothetical protein CXF71_12750 [Colwellia sp. 12G3]